MIRRLSIVAVFAICLAGTAWAALAILALLNMRFPGVPGWLPLP